MNAKTKKMIETLGFKTFGNFVRVNGTLYPLPLVQGNTKLGKTVFHSSTLPTNKEISFSNPGTGEMLTIKGTCPCTCEKCYACRGKYKLNDQKYYLGMRTQFLREYPEIYFSILEIQLNCENVVKLRIHASGDFIPGEARRYYNLLKKYPHIKAWTYTKCENDDDIKLLNTLENVNVVSSIIPGRGLNFGSVAYIAATYYYLKNKCESVFICKCGIDKKQHCSNCDGCSSHKYVLFIEHSTGYNPVKDYGYNKIVDLINSQFTEKKAA